MERYHASPSLSSSSSLDSLFDNDPASPMYNAEAEPELEPKDGDSNHLVSISEPRLPQSQSGSCSSSRLNVASRCPPPIPGLYVFPSLLPPEDAHSALEGISEADHFLGGTRDQVMFFTRHNPNTDLNINLTISSNPSAFTLPPHIATLISTLDSLLSPLLPTPTFTTLFSQPLARQVILNLYPPGKGIAPHVDLPRRYADGIVGVSLLGSCVMSFTREEEGEGKGKEKEKGCEKRYDVYLPPRTVYVLTGESRWSWAHSIEPSLEDFVLSSSGQVETILRGVRVSMTIRWMKQGADVLS